MEQARPGFLGAVMRHIACTPNANFDDAEYERGVLEPAARIRRLQEEWKEQTPPDDQVRQVVGWLLEIFETKKLPIQEREERLRELFDDYNLHSLFPDLLPLARR
jgi:[acyl-carrier-protein] S-malonyltransferase